MVVLIGNNCPSFSLAYMRVLGHSTFQRRLRENRCTNAVMLMEVGEQIGTNANERRYTTMIIGIAIAPFISSANMSAKAQSTDFSGNEVPSSEVSMISIGLACFLELGNAPLRLFVSFTQHLALWCCCKPSYITARARLYGRETACVGARYRIWAGSTT